MGMASWTDRGRSKPSRSCFNAFCRVLIKSQCLLCARVFKGFGVQIVRFEHQLFGVQQFGADEGHEELLERHAVVGEKAAQGKGKRCQDADPADLAGANHAPQAEIHAHGHSYGQQGENELPQGQAEEQAFLIVPDFFVDADFYNRSPPQ